MQIFIIGDSWGEPNWRSPLPGYSAEGHIAQRLHRLGHRVINCSRAGQGNWASWAAASEVGSTDQTDLVIWFHTEITREMPKPAGPWLYPQELDRAAHILYKQCSEVYKKRFPQARLWLVEGQSPVHFPHFHQWFQPDYWTKDWRSELVGQVLPPTQLVGALSTQDNWFRLCQNSSQEQLRWINEVEVIMQSMRECRRYFTDFCHPNNLAHYQLLKQGRQIIQELSQ